MKKNIVLIVLINLLLAFTKYIIIIDCGVIINTFVGLILAVIVDLFMNVLINSVLKRRDSDNKIKYYQLLIVSILITFIDYILIICDII